jgi:hypothetical protein
MTQVEAGNSRSYAVQPTATPDDGRDALPACSICAIVAGLLPSFVLDRPTPLATATAVAIGLLFGLVIAYTSTEPAERSDG